MTHSRPLPIILRYSPLPFSPILPTTIRMTEHHSTDIAIIGAGPVGLFAIFECGMLKMRCHVIDTLEGIGGQCTALYPEKPIYDIPAFPSIEAAELIRRLEEQAGAFSPTYHLGQRVDGLERIGDTWQLTTSAGTVIHAKAVIIAGGCGAFGPNRPPLEGLERYEGESIFYMVTRKEAFRGKRVVIAGGGDSAVDWALSLAPIAEQVYVVHRRPKFRAAPETISQLEALASAEGSNVELVIPYQLHGLEGEGGQLTAVTVATLDGEVRRLDADTLLPFFGLAMELGPIAEWGLGMEMSHITVDPATMQTSSEGVFAIGDIATYRNKLKLILCGFSEAAMAAHAAYAIVHPETALHFEYSTSKGIA
jgi:thioredoxin reductase (NADPH)